MNLNNVVELKVGSPIGDYIHCLLSPMEQSPILDCSGMDRSRFEELELDGL